VIVSAFISCSNIAFDSGLASAGRTERPDISRRATLHNRAPPGGAKHAPTTNPGNPTGS